MTEVIHCSICHKAFKVRDFEDQMKKIREHRKKVHPTAFRRSVKKGVRTRKARK